MSEKRNLSSCSNYVKEQAYNSLVRSCVEYASPCWSPFEKQHIVSIESIQCAAARFVSSDYSSYSSVTGMTHSLGWESLEKRRYIHSDVNYLLLNITPATFQILVEKTM